MANKEKLRKTGRKSGLRNSHFIAVSLAALIITVISNIDFTRRSVISTDGTTTRTSRFYPKQYSDSRITENAKVSDERFKNITFPDKTSLLANVVSILKINNYADPTGEENGSWLWTPILDITPAYRDHVLSGAKQNGVKNIYLSIDSYLDIYVLPEGEEKSKKLKEFNKIVADFIRKAKENGITVDAESGWRNWAEMGHSYKAFATVNFAIQFNKTHQEKFRGIQYDIEPYLLDYYEKNQKAVLGNFINLVDETVARLDGTDLILSVVIPEFYDHNSPTIYYAGKDITAHEQLLRILDKRSGSKIIIMSYRNWSVGDDGSIEISKDEITMGNKYNTKIILAQETGEVKPPYVTYFNTTEKYYRRQLGLLIKAFEKDKSFGGVATHYINSYIDL